MELLELSELYWMVLNWVMVPDEGLEPPTFGLQNRCTTTVLIRPEQKNILARGA